MVVNIAGLDRGAVLAALYNAASSNFPVPAPCVPPISTEEAQRILTERGGKVGILGSAVIHVDFSAPGKLIDVTYYNRCNEAAAEQVIAGLRRGGGKD